MILMMATVAVYSLLRDVSVTPIMVSFRMV